MLQNQPNLYKLEGTFDKYRIYTPTNIAEGYHLSRKVQADHQVIYSNAGATEEQLNVAMDAILQYCNDSGKLDRTNIAVIANDIKYRLKYPVDEHCAIRMGCILSFVEWDEVVGQYKQHNENNPTLSEGDLYPEVRTRTVSEDPNKYDAFFTNVKFDLAMSNPDAYTFFLSWGIANTPKYREHLDILTSMDYFNKRKEALRWGTKPLASE